MIVQTFYNGVTQALRSTIDVAADGTFFSRMEDGAHNLIKEMTLNNYQWYSEQTLSEGAEGKLMLMF